MVARWVHIPKVGGSNPSSATMVTVNITEKQIIEAEKRYPFIKLPNSITEGEGNLTGALGEIIVRDYYWYKDFIVEDNSTRNFDLYIKGMLMEIKSKKTTVVPKPYYNVSILASNPNQKCDIYYFTRIRKDLKIGYLLGYLSRDEYFKQATFNKKGEPDGWGFYFKDDCYNLQIKNLRQVV